MPGWLNATVIVQSLLAAGGLWLLFGDNLTSFLGRLKIPTTATESVSTDAEDLAAVERLYRRFEKLQCEEGKAACQTVLAHFFHAPGPH